MANLKIKRAITGSSESVEMTDELYAKLGKGNQLIAAIGEALKVPVMIAEYQGRNYVATVTIDAIAAELA